MKVSRQTIGRWLEKFKIPKKDRVFEREVKNQYGTYRRKFNIKYKKENKWLRKKLVKEKK